MAPGGRREGGHGAWVKKAPAGGEKKEEEVDGGYKGRTLVAKFVLYLKSWQPKSSTYFCIFGSRFWLQKSWTSDLLNPKVLQILI